MGAGLSGEALVEQFKDGPAEKREEALKSICDAAGRSLEKRQQIAKAGGIDLLVQVLKNKDSSDRLKEFAAAGLGHLALGEELKKPIGEAGAIESLVRVVTDGTNHCKGAAATALGSLASKCPDNQNKIGESGGVKALVSMLKDLEIVVLARAWAAAAIGNLSLSHKANQTLAGELGACELVCALLAEVAPKLSDVDSSRKGMCGCRRRDDTSSDGRVCTEQGKAFIVNALNSLGFDNPPNQAKIAQASGYEALVAMLKGETATIRLAAMSALCNVIGKSAENQTRLAETGVIPLLLKELGKESVSVNRQTKAAGVLAMLTIDHPANQDAVVKAGGIDPLVWQLHAGGAEARYFAALAVCNLASGDQAIKTQLGQVGGIPGLCKVAEEGTEKARHWACRALIKLAEGNEENQKRIQLTHTTLPIDALQASGMKVTRIIDEEDLPDNARIADGPDLPPGFSDKSSVTAAESIVETEDADGQPRRRVARRDADGDD